jgi:predicted ribosomally synthesized peptide with SipW-like signal peptide
MLRERKEVIEKMKSIFLSVVIICAIAISGIGGTLATWSDSETSMDNRIETGSVDLMVNYADDLPWGTGVPAKVQIDCMIPCKVYGPYPVDLWNAGQCTQPSAAFFHLKNMECSNIPAKEGSGYRCPETGVISPEPELVAQYGGKVNCVEVPGIGRTGDDCSMKSHVYIWIMLDDTVPEQDVDYDEDVCAYQGKINPIICEEIYLFDLVPCQPRTIYLWFHLQQDSEEMYFGDDDFINPDPWEADLTPEQYMYWLKFNDWPSWAVMKDRADFDIEFDLWLYDP